MAIIHFRCKERRRTLRVMLTVPLKVQGQTVDGETFSVETRSHTVSLHGASIELGPKVVLGDLLRLENERTREKIEGKVVTIRHSRDGKTYVGVEFIDQDVNFWHMSFPVPGAKPLRRVVTEKIAAVTT
jgi:PilZ domain